MPIKPTEKVTEGRCDEEGVGYLEQKETPVDPLIVPRGGIYDEPAVLIINDDPIGTPQWGHSMKNPPEISEDIEVIVTVERKGRTILEVNIPQLVPQLLGLERTEAISGEVEAVILRPVHEVPASKEVVIIDTEERDMNLVIAVTKEVLHILKNKGVDLQRDLTKAVIEAGIVIRRD